MLRSPLVPRIQRHAPRRPHPNDWGLNMTVCVAGIAAKRSAIIAVSDRRLTYSSIAADVDTVEKAVTIHRSWVAMFSGNDIGNVTPILDRVRIKLAEIEASGKKIGRVDVAREFRGAYRAHHRTIIEERVLAPYDLSVRRFQERGFTELGSVAFDELRHAVESTKVDCDFLVCGFSDDGPQIFVISDQGLSYYDKIGYWAIGSGQWSALSSLAFRKFHLGLSFEEALYQVLEAKFMADATDPSVGKGTYTLVIRRDGRIGQVAGDEVERVRDIWRDEGQPRTPPNLSVRMPAVLFSAKPTEPASTRPAPQGQKSPKHGQSGRTPSRA